jgi:hypothetical protein
VVKVVAGSGGGGDVLRATTSSHTPRSCAAVMKRPRCGSLIWPTVKVFVADPSDEGEVFFFFFVFSLYTSQGTRSVSEAPLDHHKLKPTVPGCRGSGPRAGDRVWDERGRGRC